MGYLIGLVICIVVGELSHLLVQSLPDWIINLVPFASSVPSKHLVWVFSIFLGTTLFFSALIAGLAHWGTEKIKSKLQTWQLGVK